MKKIINLLLVVVLIFSLAACGSKTEESAVPEKKEETEQKVEADTDKDEAKTDKDEAKTDKDEAKTDKDEAKTFRIGYASKNQDNPFQQSFVKEMHKQADERGWDVTILDAKNQIETEQANMETFITQDYDLIFINSVDPLAGAKKCKEAKDAGIPVIAIDSNIDATAEVVTLVVAPNLSGGYKVGEYMSTCYDEDEEIRAAMISGNKGNTGGLERRVGVFAGLIDARTGIGEDAAFEAAWQLADDLTNNGSAEYPDANFVLVGQGWGNWSTDGGLSAGEDLVTANPDINCMIAPNDSMLIGGYKAVENAGLLDQVQFFASHDGMKEGLELIKEGTQYKATGLNHPRFVVAKGWDIADEILVGGADPEAFDPLITTDPIAITIENVDDFYDPNADF
ncbi:MAG TPA: substrate-binding domain-containing protein [Clostridiaceae bacterium]|nr:substrate-binding domain-containing protein [Clostridiaceae bacterium]